MKVVLLAGGKGTRLAEETGSRPKPMVEIGGRPLLWHIMKIYDQLEVSEFIVCLGHLGSSVKDYFLSYHRHRGDLTIDLGTGAVVDLGSQAEQWRVTLVDTGEDTMTAGRLRRVMPLIGDETFCMTYGDGVADVDLRSEITFHEQHKRLATVLAVRPQPRFGALDIGADGRVRAFREKPTSETGLVNGGFFVLEPGIASYLSDDDAMPFEHEPLRQLAADGELGAYVHDGFWQPCDTLRDKRTLEDLWQTDTPPWRTWTDD